MQQAKHMLMHIIPIALLFAGCGKRAPQDSQGCEGGTRIASSQLTTYPFHVRDTTGTFVEATAIDIHEASVRPEGVIKINTPSGKILADFSYVQYPELAVMFAPDVPENADDGILGYGRWERATKPNLESGDGFSALVVSENNRGKIAPLGNMNPTPQEYQVCVEKEGGENGKLAVYLRKEK